MLDWNKIKAKASELYSESSKKIRQYTPESFSKEKKFVNALVISLVLMTMADKKAETEEITSSMDLINEIDEIKELELTQEAIELYELHLENLMNVVDNSAKWTLAIAKLLSEVGKVKPYPEYPPMIENLLDYISESDGNVDPLEIEMKNKILASIK
jgi:tellurite resistance protein